jgi:hypothetical protein
MLLSSRTTYHRQPCLQGCGTCGMRHPCSEGHTRARASTSTSCSPEQDTMSRIHEMQAHLLGRVSLPRSPSVHAKESRYRYPSCENAGQKSKRHTPRQLSQTNPNRKAKAWRFTMPPQRLALPCFHLTYWLVREIWCSTFPQDHLRRFLGGVEFWLDCHCALLAAGLLSLPDLLLYACATLSCCML